MVQHVVINLGCGSLSAGCSYITAQLSERKGNSAWQCQGSLPPNPELGELFHRWQLIYRAFYQMLGVSSHSNTTQSSSTRQLTIAPQGLTNFSEIEFRELCSTFHDQLNQWLRSESFQPIHLKICQAFNIKDDLVVLLETDDALLRKLPWHLWDFFETYPNAEFILGTPEYAPVSQQKNSPNRQVRILAIFGHRTGLDLDAERQAIKDLPGTEITFVDAPTQRQVNEHLWEDAGWDILFFAGHSQTDLQTDTGQLQINEQESLDLNQLKLTIKHALRQGLKLAIFNSCDGLGVATTLSEINIPQIIVMREIVPDPVAQFFFKVFLESFISGPSLFNAFKEARQQLEGLEDQYPCATWLPLLCQHPATKPLTWQQLQGPTQSTILSRTKNYLSLGLGITLASTLVLLGVRHFGLIQDWELMAYDHLMQERPIEDPDERFLIVTVSENDLNHRPPQKAGADSLPDSQLIQLLDEVIQHHPSSIGLDIFRPQTALSHKLGQYLQSPNVFGICQVEDKQDANHPDIAPSPQVTSERLGFSDVVLDPDNVLRRALLVMGPRPASMCQTQYALSAQLAFHFLDQQGIAIRYTHHNELQLGSVLVPRVPSPKTIYPLHQFVQDRQGGYQNVDAWGYQTLINYRAHRSLSDGSFEQVTLQEVLKGQLNPQSVKNKIVLIGVSAKSFGDLHTTPFSPKDAYPGVMIQAEMTSQLISAALDGRPLLSVWPLWLDALWIWSWMMASHMLFWLLRKSIFKSLGLGVILGVGLYYLCWMLLIQGIWVPLVPAAFGIGAMGISALVLSSVSAHRLRRLS